MINWYYNIDIWYHSVPLSPTSDATITTTDTATATYRYLLILGLFIWYFQMPLTANFKRVYLVLLMANIRYHFAWYQI